MGLSADKIYNARVFGWLPLRCLSANKKRAIDDVVPSIPATPLSRPFVAAAGAEDFPTRCLCCHQNHKMELLRDCESDVGTERRGGMQGDTKTATTER